MALLGVRTVVTSSQLCSPERVSYPSGRNVEGSSLTATEVMVSGILDAGHAVLARYGSGDTPQSSLLWFVFGGSILRANIGA